MWVLLCGRPPGISVYETGGSARRTANRTHSARVSTCSAASAGWIPTSHQRLSSSHLASRDWCGCSRSFAAGGQARVEALLRRIRSWWEQSAWKQSRRRRRASRACGPVVGESRKQAQAPVTELCMPWLDASICSFSLSAVHSCIGAPSDSLGHDHQLGSHGRLQAPFSLSCSPTAAIHKVTVWRRLSPPSRPSPSAQIRRPLRRLPDLALPLPPRPRRPAACCSRRGDGRGRTRSYGLSPATTACGLTHRSSLADLRTARAR